MMYGNPLLTALFDDKSSIPSSRLNQVRSQFNSHLRFILLVPPTLALLNVDPQVLYQDMYLLSHIVVLELGKYDYRQPFSAPTLTSGWTVSFTESHVAGQRGFPSQDPVRISHTYTWNPGVSYVSSEQVFYVVELKGLLVPLGAPKRFDFFRRGDAPEDGSIEKNGSKLIVATDELRKPTHSQDGVNGSEALDLEQLIGNKRGQRSKASAILGPILSKINVEESDTLENLSQLFRQAVSDANAELASLGIESLDAVHEYFEYQLSQRISVLIQEKTLASPRLEEAQTKLQALDIRQVGLPQNTDWFGCEALIRDASSRIESLSNASVSTEMIDILVGVVSLLGHGPSGPFSADSLLGLLLLAIIRSKNYPWIDTAVSHVRHFSSPSQNVDSGTVGYALLTFESVFVHLREDYEKMVQLADSNTQLWEAVTDHHEKSRRDESRARFHVTSSDNVSTFDEIATAVKRDNSVLLSHRDGDSILFHAIKSSKIQLFAHLLSTFPEVFTPGYLIDDFDADGRTLLMCAIDAENTEIISMLLDTISTSFDEHTQRWYFQRADRQGRTVAHLLHHHDSLITTIGHLLDWNRRDYRGMSPLLTLSRCYDHPSYDHMLVLALAKWAQKPNVSLYDHMDKDGNSLLHTINPTTDELIKKLFDMPDIDVNWLNDKGQSPLMLAAKYDREVFVKTLIEKGSNIWQRDNTGVTVFDVSKGASTQILYKYFLRNQISRRALKTSLVNNTCFFTISNEDGQMCHRSIEDIIALRILLQNNHPHSWVPPIAGDTQVILDPWKTYRFSMKLIGYSVDYFLRLVTSHSTFKTSEEVQAFFLDKDWTPPQLQGSKKLGRDGHRQKQQNADGSEKVGYSEEEGKSIVTFFTFSIEQLTSFRLLFIRLSTAHSRLLNSREGLNRLWDLLFKLIADFDPQNLSVMIPEMVSRSQHPGTTIQIPHNVYLICQARSTASLMDALERPIRSIEQLRQAETELEAQREELSRLGSTKAWPLAYFEDKRVQAMQDTEAEIFTTRAKIDRLTSSITATHDTLASELGSFQKFQAQELMTIMGKYTEDSIQQHKDMLSRCKRSLTKIRLSNYSSHSH